MTSPARILVVDDHPEQLHFFRRVLTEAGHHVVESGNGGQALTQVIDEEPDLVILDLVLPDISGWEVARTIKKDERTRDIPVLLVAAAPHHASDQWSGDGDCDALLVQPIEPKRLLAEVDRWL